MKHSLRSSRLALAALCGAFAMAASAQTDVAAPTEAAADKVQRIVTPMLTDKKLQMLHERIERKIKMSNPARADQPQAAVAFYANKRTGPIITRGPDITTGMRPLDTKAYADAIALVRRAALRKQAPGMLAAVVAGPGSLLGNWSNLGPNNQGGRTRQLLIDPANPSIMYAASVGGGVWKSSNGGASWNQLTDLILPNIAVASLAMDPSNSQVLYAGTGEGFFNGDAIRGNGVYKSTDGGSTWTSLAVTVPAAGVAGNFSYVNQIVVSARYPQRVYAATRTGLFRSNDGGATWATIINATAVNGCQDLVMQQKRSIGYVFASCGTFTTANIYRGLDSPSSAFASVYTTTNMGRTALAIAPSNESYVYAMAANMSSHGMLGIFRSTANGSAGSWTTQVASTDPIKLNTLQLTNPVYAYAECVGGSVGLYNQGWYDNVIAVDPVNPEVVWTGGIDLMRSDDGGRNWGVASYWWAGSGFAEYAHADNHVIRFHPGYDGAANQKMYVASDGGVFRTDNARAAVGKTVDNVCGNVVPGAVAWTELNNQYATTQFYHGAVYPHGDAYLGGMQDNGTWRGTTASGSWAKLLGGDGGYVAVDTQGDANAANDVLFGEYTGLSIQRSTDGGANFSDAVSGISESGGNFLFIAPMAMNAGNRQQLWTGGYFIWRTVDQGSSWTRASALTAGLGSVAVVAASPTDPNRVIVGMSDGYIHSTATALSNTSATIWPSTRPRTVFVSAVTFDPNNALVAYATYSTFSGTSVYKSTNGGASWVGMPGTGANLLPRVPATAVVVDPSNGSRVYVGTDIGVYTSADGGLNWYRENAGFGNVSVEHLEINTVGTKRLFAFTHGRGAWRVDLIPDAPP